MKRKQWKVDTKDGKSLQAYRWQQEDLEAQGIVYIAHGMAEHSLRYEPFIEFLTANGFIVYANDHRGHGKSRAPSEPRGYFAKQDGFEKVVDDLALLLELIIDTKGDLPLFLFGHSMGSLLVRRLIQRYRFPINGVLLSGTAGDPKWLGTLGLFIAKTEKFLRGAKKPSPLMNRLIFGNYNKAFSPQRTDFDFLTREQIAVDDYIKDEDCGFICTTSFYVDLLEGTLKLHEDEEVAKIPKDLPIFLFSGDTDPVGDFGKGVQAVYEQYLAHDMTQVSIKLYEEGRHEMLHEINKMEVYTDILNWLETMVKGEVQ